jgi:HK97 family phage portal protein
MALFNRRSANINEQTAAAFSRHYGGMTSTGSMVSHANAPRHSAVWACLSAIAEAVQQLPIEEVRANVDGTSARLRPPKVFYQPAPDIAWETWVWQQVWTLASRGKCYALVTSQDDRGVPKTLVPVSPDCVEWRFDRQANVWRVLLDRAETKLWPLGPLWHCPLYALPGQPEGLSPIAFHAETIGVGLAAQKFGAQFFGDGGHPTMIGKIAGTDPGGENAKQLKNKLMEVMRGNREPLIVPESLTLDRWSVAPNESQFLDTMRYSGEDVCRVFGVPPGKVGLAISGQSMTYTNTAQANTDWRTSGLSRYIVQLESALSRLLPGDSGRVLRFDFDAFLRADLAARAAAYKTFTEIGQMSGTPVMFTNEMRNEEGLPPVDGGDTFTRMQPRSVADITRMEGVQ